MRTATTLMAGLLLLVQPAAASAGSQPSSAPSPSQPTPSTDASPGPSPVPTVDQLPGRPVLAPALPRPNDPPPRLDTNRRPDGVVWKRGVRLELWVPRKPVRVGNWLPATLRVTNVRDDVISHSGCQHSSATATLDIAGLFDDGVAQEGRAERFKRQFLEASGMSRYPMPRRPRGGYDCRELGVGTWESVLPGGSFTVPVAFHVRYPWRDQPLPSGRTRVTARYRFSTEPELDGDRVDLEVSALVWIKGIPVIYPSPQTLADAALAHPEFRQWVETRWERADFSPNVQGIHAGRRAWVDLRLEGGPAPIETIAIGSQPGGTVRKWLRSLRIDPWTATVEEVDLVSY